MSINTPATHKSHKHDLPPVRAHIIKSESETTLTTIPQAIQDWYEDEESNLIVVMGGFGTGKSSGILSGISASNIDHELLDFHSVASIGEGKVRHAISNMEIQNDVVIVDNFNAVNNITEVQVTPPDLTSVTLLSEDHRVIISTRRTYKSFDDELLRQLESSSRLERLGFLNPFVVQVLPWEVKDLKEYASEKGDESLKNIASFLGSLPSEQTRYLRRPLLVSMLLEMGERILSLDDIPSITEIHVKYCDAILSIDYDNRRSRLSSSDKHRILTELAFDIFSGKGTEYGKASALSVSLDRVSERVLEYVYQNKKVGRDEDSSSYHWTQDFIKTNHILDRISQSDHYSYPIDHYYFIDKSFYEYFVARALTSRIHKGEPIGLQLDQISAATFESLIFIIMEELGGPELAEAIKNILSRPRLSKGDRLIFYYLLEDDSEFEDILNDAPSEYLDALEDAHETTDHFFLQKVMRYQLVIGNRYSAYDYIEKIKEEESEDALRVERRLHSTTTGVTDQLIKRLKNPSLKKARPITVYRLKQLGDKSAIPVLETVKAYVDDEKFKRHVRNAIQKIRERYDE